METVNTLSLGNALVSRFLRPNAIWSLLHSTCCARNRQELRQPEQTEYTKSNATHSRASIQADVDCSAEEDKIGVGKFEGAETGRQRIAVDRIEILE